MTRLEAIDALQPKGSKMTERVDLDAVRDQVMTVQTGGNVYVFAEDYAALLAERDVLEAENQRLRKALKPFSDEATWWFTRNYNASEAPVEGFSDYQAIMTVGDLFNARTVLVEQEKQDD